MSDELIEDYSEIEPAHLREFLETYQVPIYSGGKVQGERRFYYLPCPFKDDHTDEIASTSSYIIAEGDGELVYGCFHEHCKGEKGRLSKAWRKGRSGWNVFHDAVTCPIRMGLMGIGVEATKISHDDKARFYENVVCPRNNEHRGTAIYRKADGKCAFMCHHEGCEPAQWQEFMAIHGEMGVQV